MFQKAYLVWGTVVCLGLMMAQVAGWQLPTMSFGGGGSGYSGTGGFGSPSRGSGGFSGFGGGK